MRNHLKRGLAGLPAPRNDFEIVVPEDMNENMEEMAEHHYIEDQADLDDQAEADRLARGKLNRNYILLQIILMFINGTHENKREMVWGSNWFGQ